MLKISFYRLLIVLFCLADRIIQAQTFSVPTNHQSISMEVKNMGWTADIFVKNDHVSDTYIVSYTIEFNLKCGGLKTYSQNDIYINPGKIDDQGGYTISVPEVQGCERGISSARLISFRASPKIKESQNLQINTTTNSKNRSDNSTIADSDAHPGPNASIQELAAWQRRQSKSETITPANQTIQNVQTPLTSTPQITPEQAASQWRLEAEQNSQFQSTSNEQLANDIIDLGVGIGSLIGDFAQEKREKEERERLQKLRQVEELKKQKEIETERLRQQEIKNMILLKKMRNRTSILDEYPMTAIPLGSTVPKNSIYFFFYSIPSDFDNAEYSRINVSNVFEIKKYLDGTFPYTEKVLIQIEHSTPSEEILYGYFTAIEDAEYMRNSLITRMEEETVSADYIDFNIVDFSNRNSNDKNSSRDNTPNQPFFTQPKENLNLGKNKLELNKTSTTTVKEKQSNSSSCMDKNSLNMEIKTVPIKSDKNQK